VVLRTNSSSNHRGRHIAPVVPPKRQRTTRGGHTGSEITSNVDYTRRPPMQVEVDEGQDKPKWTYGRPRGKRSLGDVIEEDSNETSSTAGGETAEPSAKRTKQSEANVAHATPGGVVRVPPIEPPLAKNKQQPKVPPQSIEVPVAKQQRMMKEKNMRTRAAKHKETEEEASEAAGPAAEIAAKAPAMPTAQPPSNITSSSATGRRPRRRALRMPNLPS
jgi:type IV secretory pathway VirB10-like protein